MEKKTILITERDINGEEVSIIVTDTRPSLVRILERYARKVHNWCINTHWSTDYTFEETVQDQKDANFESLDGSYGSDYLKIHWSEVKLHDEESAMLFIDSLKWDEEEDENDV